MSDSLSKIYSDLIMAIGSCPEFPENVQIHIGETDSRKSAMSIVVDLDNSKSRKNICGEWLKAYSLDLFYQVVAQTDKQKSNVFDLLNNISNFIVENSKSFNINWIETVSSPKMIGKNNNGLDVFLTKFLVR